MLRARLANPVPSRHIVPLQVVVAEDVGRRYRGKNRASRVLPPVAACVAAKPRSLLMVVDFLFALVAIERPRAPKLPQMLCIWFEGANGRVHEGVERALERGVP